jgi:hypothetical protein
MLQCLKLISIAKERGNIPVGSIVTKMNADDQNDVEVVSEGMETPRFWLNDRLVKI